MSKKNPLLKYKQLWLIVGYGLIAYVLYSSLTSDPITMDVKFFDKYAHVFGYFVLMGWFMQIYHAKKTVYMCAIFFIVMGISLEFLQAMTGYRFFDVYDMLANTTGVLLAWMLVRTPFPEILSYIESKLLKN
ncbi:MAG: hypothetical protein DIZ80_11970 [endosymbiont of Galathealinum brachiosum]|uniref:VanZ-like domain-containing protein n=1 Tax=endosymbiont of Galathealinum brachiosum TaxID=2200906 RepID=A0A370DDP6_9GAMM|nr:MAG: hypothetical protein DIZ80_11970 [endosymbiont of Galathealinum brachiosum]